MSPATYRRTTVSCFVGIFVQAVVTNLTAILLLSKVALKLANDYHRQRTLGKLPTFDANRFPELKSQLEPGVWDKN